MSSPWAARRSSSACRARPTGPASPTPLDSTTAPRTPLAPAGRAGGRAVGASSCLWACEGGVGEGGVSTPPLSLPRAGAGGGSFDRAARVRTTGRGWAPPGRCTPAGAGRERVSSTPPLIPPRARPAAGAFGHPAHRRVSPARVGGGQGEGEGGRGWGWGEGRARRPPGGGGAPPGRRPPAGRGRDRVSRPPPLTPPRARPGAGSFDHAARVRVPRARGGRGRGMGEGGRVWGGR